MNKREGKSMKKSIALKLGAVSLLLALCLGLSGCVSDQVQTQGTITAVNASGQTIEIKTDAGQSQTVSVGAKTCLYNGEGLWINKGFLTLDEIHAGQYLVVKQSPNPEGKLIADRGDVFNQRPENLRGAPATVPTAASTSSPTAGSTIGAQPLGTIPASNPGGSNYTLKTDPAAEAAFPDVARKYRETPVKPELPEEAHKYVVQGDFAIEKRNLPVAIDRYTDALKIAPWWPEGYLKRGQLLAEIELYNAAIADMKKFLLLAPDTKEAREAQDNIYKWESASNLAVPKSTTPGGGESAFTGHLSGQYSGHTHSLPPWPQHGTFDFIINADGTVAATADKASMSGKVDTAGHITVSANTDLGYSFTGQLTKSGNTLSGRGTWEKFRKAQFMIPAGTIASGDWSGSGDDTSPTTPAPK